MPTIELTIDQLTPGEVTEIAIALLTAEGYEGFEENESHLTAYIAESAFGSETLQQLKYNHPLTFGNCNFSTRTLADQNWNALWESNFAPVEIDGQCRIRAPFHATDPRFSLELVIEPRMAFGTGHHQTTTLMVRYLLQHPPAGKRLLDMGTGTGILAIAGKKLGADYTIAIDNDEWAYRNCIENIHRNSCPDIVVLSGGAEAIPDLAFNLILANINRNILLADMAVYAKHLAPNGQLVMSGFYLADLEAITDNANKLGLQYITHTTLDNWTMAEFVRE